MSAPAGDWPTELFEILFDSIDGNNSSRQSGLLTSGLRVSPRWGDIGLQMIWAHISLTSKQLSAIPSAPEPSNYRFVGSLTLLIEARES